MPSGKPHYRITLADALSAHAEALLTGGRDGVIDLGSIDAAINRPYTGYYRPMARKAAALVQSIATNHGFVDGNKRTAVILAHVLIRRSGYQLTLNRGEEIDDVVVDVVNHQFSLDDLEQWFKERLRRIG